MMEHERKNVLMRMVDGELDRREAEDLAGSRLSFEEIDYVAGLAMERALLRAAFPIERTGRGAEEQRVIDRAFAARRSARSSWRIGFPLAASVLAAAIVGYGTVLLAERRTEQTASRLFASFADGQKLRLTAFVEALDRTISGQSVAWRNAQSGSVTPLRTFQAVDGRWCREYRQELELSIGSEQ